MTAPRTVRDTRGMLSGMTPSLVEGVFIFCTTTDEQLADRARPAALASFREAEGLSFVLPLDLATNLGFDCVMPMRQLVLKVFSSLEGVGLTAAVASALAAHAVPCNMIAAYHHDHVFVPAQMAERALAILLELQAGTSP